MLHIGLTGGIGAGKSTVAATLARLGAVVLDADALAREAVAPGSAGLAAVIAAFGRGVLAADGGLDRAAMARVVFGDDDARQRLEAIVHPRVRELTAARVALLPADAVVVHDVPLIVEKGLAPGYHLVVVVSAPAEERVRRLVTDRGMAEPEARRRIAAQADDAARHAVADVWVDTDRPRQAVDEEVQALWRDRLVQYGRNVVERRPAHRDDRGVITPPDGFSAWDVQAARLVPRLRRVGGARVVDVEHVGATAVPGVPAEDVVEIQVGVASPEDAEALAEAWADAGFPAVHERAVPAGRLHRNADPARAVDLVVRVAGSPAWRDALALRDWLRADAAARTELVAARRDAADRGGTPGRHPWRARGAAQQDWLTGRRSRLEAWAGATGWRPPS
nr:dephospho-CoA kinase [uncultured Actinotalea sp.]